MSPGYPASIRHRVAIELVTCPICKGSGFFDQVSYSSGGSPEHYTEDCGFCDGKTEVAVKVLPAVKPDLLPGLRRALEIVEDELAGWSMIHDRTCKRIRDEIAAQGDSDE